jgi:hypothetical protein
VKLRTLTQLDDRLSAELARRKVELAALKGVIARNDGPTRRSLLRASVMMLYAHWEGFVKEAATSYLNYVSFQSVESRALADNIVAVTLRTELLACGVRRPSVHNLVVAALRNQAGGTANVPWSNVIDARDNLRSDVLREIAHVIGVDYSAYATREVFIDRSLCDLRNAIAHGKSNTITVEEFETLHAGVIGLLEQVRIDVSNAASRELFRVPSAPIPPSTSTQRM